MSKRFTDTGIWKNQKWFRSLPLEYKLVFLYIKDNCDHAGLWKADASQILDDLGIGEIDLKAFIDSCNIDHDKFTGKQVKRDRIRVVNEDVLWLTGFVQFQYGNKDSGEVNPKGNFVKSALSVLEANNLLNESLSKGYITLSEPLDTPSVRVKGKGKDIIDKRGGKSSRASDEEIEQIYQAYPRKVGKGAAKKKIEIALREIPFDDLIERVEQYAECVKDKDSRYIPYPATWFFQERYDDDPKEWEIGEDKNEAEAFDPEHAKKVREAHRGS